MIPELEEIRGLGAEVTMCGSKVTCDPPPEGTDTDYLVYCKDEIMLSDLVGWMEEHEWVWEGDTEHYQKVAGSGFMSWRKGFVNLIVTSSRTFVERHKLATRVCKRLNLMDKKQRIEVFQEILYGDGFGKEPLTSLLTEG